MLRLSSSQLQTASAVWKWAIRHRRPPLKTHRPNPFPALRVTSKDVRTQAMARTGLGSKDAGKLLEAVRETCPAEAAFIIEAALQTGWRLGDLAGLTWADYDHEYRVDGKSAPKLAVRRAKEKTGARKIAFPSGAVLEHLEALRTDPTLRPHPQARIFRQPNGSGWGDPKRTNWWLRKAIAALPRNAINRDLLEGDDFHLPFSFHSLRHTARTILRELGVDDLTAAALLGHSGGNGSASRYTHVLDAPILDACRQLAGSLGSPTGSPNIVAKRRSVASGDAG